MILWRIYYADGSTYDSTSPVYNTPATGAILIVQKDKDHGRLILADNFFVWDDRGDGAKWWAGDRDGLEDYLYRDGWKKVVRGRWIPNEQWNQIWAKANADPDFPVRTAFHSKERHP